MRFARAADSSSGPAEDGRGETGEGPPALVDDDGLEDRGGRGGNTLTEGEDAAPFSGGEALPCPAAGLAEPAGKLGDADCAALGFLALEGSAGGASFFGCGGAAGGRVFEFEAVPPPSNAAILLLISLGAASSESLMVDDAQAHSPSFPAGSRRTGGCAEQAGCRRQARDLIACGLSSSRYPRVCTSKQRVGLDGGICAC